MKYFSYLCDIKTDMHMTIDELFTQNGRPAAALLSDEVQTVPAAGDEGWEAYYKTVHGFYSYWKLRIELPYVKETSELRRVDDYLRRIVGERIGVFLAVFCPSHSDVRTTVVFEEKYARIEYDFFADFFHNIPGYMEFCAFIYRLRLYVRERYPIVVTADRWRERVLMWLVMDEERNGVTEQKTNMVTELFTWGYILNTLRRGDTEEMDSKDWRDACRIAKFEVPGSALYDILTTDDPQWISEPLISASASTKAFVQAYMRLFGDLSYAVLRSDEHPEPTPYIVMHWLWRHINRHIRMNNKRPLPPSWLAEVAGMPEEDTDDDD